MNSMASGKQAAKICSKRVLRVVLGTAAILLIPLVAMQFTRDVNWTASDFVIAAVLLAGSGTLLELARAKLRTRSSRLIAGAAIGFGFLFIWAELAVGLVGSPFAGS